MNERMIIISKKYSVYLHVFPDGKKYVGSTSMELRQRWGGGLGYQNQKRVFIAILKYGWENIRHYVLYENLDKETALAIESALIHSWKTHMKGKGYNGTLPKIAPPDGFVVPTFSQIPKAKVQDSWENDIRTRYEQRALSANNKTHNNCKPIRLIETGETFKSATIAAQSMGTHANNISYAARSGYACGTCWISNEEEGWQMEVPAHWEYIN